jgi:hypothetical protein
MAFPIIAAALGLAGFAPIIARWFEVSQAQGAAAKVVDIARQVTGVIDPLEAIHRLQEDKDMETAFQKAIIEKEAEIELLFLKDRQDARARDARLTQAGWPNRRADVMVIVAALGLILCLALLVCFSHTLSGEAHGIISAITGMFCMCLRDAYAFEFGSSRGSKQKDDTVAAALRERNKE